MVYTTNELYNEAQNSDKNKNKKLIFDKKPSSTKPK